MGIYIGIDGGGSKTDFLCMNSAGERLAACRLGGSYYRQDGAQRVAETLSRGAAEVLSAAGEHKADAVMFGMPGLGESPEADRQAVDLLRGVFPQSAFYAANDVEVGYYAAFSGRPGILLVGGTGSMAWGRDAEGHQVRCGGWSEFFGDEGSGYWIGKKAMELFSKESDGRLPKTAFYNRARELFGLAAGDSDYLAIERIERDYAGDRRRVASLCLPLAQAAETGDAEAKKIFEEAAAQLAAIVCAVHRALRLPDPAPVSCMGGLFLRRELVLDTLETLVTREFSAVFTPPERSPCEGAVLMAAERTGDEALSAALRAGRPSGT